jgi:hypothetical protein
MTTNTYTTTWDHSTTAGFRAWGSALSAAIQACGCALTADTGQINWATVNVPAGANTAAGYEIYAFTDTLQATSPIYIKLEYGTGPLGAANYPMLWVTVGTATNGAGTLTGTTTVRQNLLCNYNASGGISSAVTPYPTYVSFDGSYLGVAHKIGGLSTYNGGGFSGGTFMVGRQCDPATGAYIGGGVTLLSPAIGPSSVTAAWVSQSLNTSTNTRYSANTGYFAMVPYSMTNSTIAALSEYQIFPCFGTYNKVVPLAWAAYGLNAETPQGSTVSATIVGASALTYLMTGACSYGAAIPTSSLYSLLMKYQ